MSHKAPKELKVVLGYLTTEDLNQAITALQNTSLHIVDVAENGTELVRRAIETEADALIYPADLPGLDEGFVEVALTELLDDEGNELPSIKLDPQHPPVGAWLDPVLHAYRKFLRAQGAFYRLLKRYHYPLVTLTMDPLDWIEEDFQGDDAPAQNPTLSQPSDNQSQESA